MGLSHELSHEQRFHGVEAGFEHRLWGNEEQHQGMRKTEARTRMQDIGGDLLQPVSQQEHFLFTDTPGVGPQGSTLPFNQISCPRPVFGTQGVQDGLGGLVMIGIPKTGTMVQAGQLIRLVCSSW